MDREVIAQKLKSLRRCRKRVEEKCPSDPATLEREPDLQDIITLNLTRAVQLRVDIGSHLIAERDVPPPGYDGPNFRYPAQVGVIDSNLGTQLKKAVGFRNIAVHNYQAIDWAIVHTLARHHFGDFTVFAKAISARITV